VNENSKEIFGTASVAPGQRHPAWCDRALCTANAASQAEGYRSEVGGQHRSADVPLDIRPRVWPVPDRIVAFLSEAVAPWRCSTYLRIAADGDEVVSEPVESAAPVLAILSDLVNRAEADWETSPR
jgi:hypothetical protein